MCHIWVWVYFSSVSGHLQMCHTWVWVYFSFWKYNNIETLWKYTILNYIRRNIDITQKLMVCHCKHCLMCTAAHSTMDTHCTAHNLKKIPLKKIQSFVNFCELCRSRARQWGQWVAIQYNRWRLCCREHHGMFPVLLGFEMIFRDDYKSLDFVSGLIIFPQYHFKPRDRNIPWCSLQKVTIRIILEET